MTDFGKTLEVNKAHLDQIITSIKHQKLIPFIGAGMSMSSSLPSWSELILSFTEKAVSRNELNENLKDFIVNQINQYKYEEAAQLCSTLASTFEQELQAIFKKIDDNAIHGAIRKFPKLGIGRYLTTNFDNILESLLGVDYDILLASTLTDDANRARFNGKYILKLHGDINIKSSWILTQEQYKRHYLESSSISSLISDIFKNNVILFTGCSLFQDRITSIVSTIQKRSFAIIAESPDHEENIETTNRLKSLNITPILLKNELKQEVNEVYDQQMDQLLDYLIEKVTGNKMTPTIDIDKFKASNKIKEVMKEDSLQLFSKEMYESLLDELTTPEKFFNSNFYCNRQKTLNDMSEILNDRGIVIIEGPQLSGKSELIRKFELINKSKFTFIESIEHKGLQELLNDDKDEFSDDGFDDESFDDEKKPKENDKKKNLLDLYVAWGRTIILQAAHELNISIPNSPEILTIAMDSVKLKKHILNKRDFVSSGNNYLECMLLLVKELLEKYSVDTLIISAHLDNFQSYANDTLYDAIIKDLSGINILNINKGSSLNKIKLMVTTRFFPINQLKKIVLRAPEFSEGEINVMLKNLIEHSDTSEINKITERILQYTNGYPWFVYRLMHIYLVKRINGDSRDPLIVVEDIFTNPNYWKKNVFKNNAKELPKFVLELIQLIRLYPNHKQGFFNFLNQKENDIDNLRNFITNPIVVESGWIRLVKSSSEIIVKGFGNHILREYYTSEYLNLEM